MSIDLKSRLDGFSDAKLGLCKRLIESLSSFITADHFINISHYWLIDSLGSLFEPGRIVIRSPMLFANAQCQMWSQGFIRGFRFRRLLSTCQCSVPDVVVGPCLNR